MNTRDPHDVHTLPAADRLTSAHWKELWIDGDPSSLAAPLVAIIGTRDADPVSAALTRRMAMDLARAKVKVLSGGAIGIDAAAHRGAIQGGGRTVVVLPSGLAHWYPKRHEALYQQVIAGGGALVSQFPPETPPTQWTFPRRNELVAALADLVVVVQAPVNSGALLAADHARKLGRRVMAVPAAPTDRRGAGCVQLLRTGALPCASAEDVLAALAEPSGPLVAWARTRGGTGDGARGKASRVRATRARERVELPGNPEDDASLGALDEGERLVYDSLASVARHVDELTKLTGLPTANVQRALLTLMLAGLANDRGDGKFTRG